MSDPAFLFYPADWTDGTRLFTFAEKGAYLELLLTQNANGHLSLDEIKHVLGNDFQAMWETKLRRKFEVDERGLFYNDKLDRVRNERRRFVESRLRNLKTPHTETLMDSHTAPHGGNGNGNGDISGDGDDPRFDTFWHIYPPRRGKKIGKADARIAFSGLKAKEKDDILIAVKNYAASDTLPKDPVRFIRKDYWREWLEPETKSDPYATMRRA